MALRRYIIEKCVVQLSRAPLIVETTWTKAHADVQHRVGPVKPIKKSSRLCVTVGIVALAEDHGRRVAQVALHLQQGHVRGAVAVGEGLAGKHRVEARCVVPHSFVLSVEYIIPVPAYNCGKGKAAERAQDGLHGARKRLIPVQQGSHRGTHTFPAHSFNKLELNAVQGVIRTIFRHCQLKTCCVCDCQKQRFVTRKTGGKGETSPNHGNTRSILQCSHKVCGHVVNETTLVSIMPIMAGHAVLRYSCNLMLDMVSGHGLFLATCPDVRDSSYSSNCSNCNPSISPHWQQIRGHYSELKRTYLSRTAFGK
eukprot:CAMPEP_0204565828 /NCGR_PEP_ID=MMETSP0661-20131031/35699_1 /ASSEMBLY_ACC=CAM_ASM_000606 /TAXON_ID=109239 /ORGANISM="Alexandrium margalefi, Strain AMGDE01CS-322" /LENGTH=309 /DNA_ID=CAMNT_0051573617 /DNA_START=256 /DNA_END=1183 /DNA_ORIENTATION=-